MTRRERDLRRELDALRDAAAGLLAALQTAELLRDQRAADVLRGRR